MDGMLTALVDRVIARFPRTGPPLLWLRKHRKGRRTLVMCTFHVLGALTSIRAILDVRTSQGAVAWAISLNTIPYVAVPPYWIFGRSDFQGYVMLRRENEKELGAREQEVARDMEAMRPPPEREPESAKLMEKLAMMPPTRGNHAELLIDGEATFNAIFDGIGQARDYVLVQFYIMRDDGVGRRLKDALIARARAGVRCHLLYDEVGSHDLPAPT